MDLIKEIIIPNPPTKYEMFYKKEKFDRDGKRVLKTDYYLTSNLYFGNNLSYHILYNITNACKKFLLPFLQGLPELEKMDVDITYFSTTHIDLDNKMFFWKKLIFDILKTPTPKQLENAHKRKKEIITTNTIVDDNTKVICNVSEHFEIGEHRMVIKIYGRVKSTQVEMPLFFT